MKRTPLLIGLVLLLVPVVILVYGSGWFFAAKPLVADELEKTALADGNPAGQQTAAAALISLGEPALPNIRRVLQHCQSPEVRAIMLQGVAQTRDLDSLEDVFKAMDDDSYAVRVQALNAFQRIEFFGGERPVTIPTKFQAKAESEHSLFSEAVFNPKAPHEARLKAIKGLRQQLEAMKKEADRQIREGLGKRDPGQPEVPVGSAKK